MNALFQIGAKKVDYLLYISSMKNVYVNFVIKFADMVIEDENLKKKRKCYKYVNAKN